MDLYPDEARMINKRSIYFSFPRLLNMPFYSWMQYEDSTVFLTLLAENSIFFQIPT